MATDTGKTDVDHLDSPLHTFPAGNGEIEAGKGSGLELGDAKGAGEALERNDAFPERGPVTPDIEDDIVSLLEEGRKILAIKLYRRQTGAGLKEAKDAVEALATKYEISPKAAGCAGMVLLMVAISTVLGVGAWVLSG
ncbi:MAG: hypothetical protein ACLP9L_39690 [Thermoguttaceae bacterium]